MNIDHQDTHKSNGSQHGKVSHRPLNEDVLQSAVEAVKDEVLGSVQPHTRYARRIYQGIEDRLTRFVMQEPMKASIMALCAGALLALVLEKSLKRLVRPTS